MEKIQIKTDIIGDIEKVKKIAGKRIGVPVDKIKYFKVCKRSIDARDKGNICILWSVEVDKNNAVVKEPVYPKTTPPKERVVVVGFGPAGMFSALLLARCGLKPLVIERGGNVDKRKSDVDTFVKTRNLNVNSNVQFGEGGAGTFSDGKLNTGIKSEFKEFVLNEFVTHGAPERILYDAKPHIGSDKLPIAVKNIRQEIIALGGDFAFDTTLVDIQMEKNQAKSITVCKDNKQTTIAVSELVLAIGHSARDTFEMLYNKGFLMERKDMAIGFRIEHLAKDINYAQYGKNYNHPNLGAADYKLTSGVSDRGVFTFCMCPGGYVMPATSEQGMVVTNGMSLFARDGVNSNSAVVVQVSQKDYGEGNVLKGIDYQREIERKAFVLGGEDYSAPVSLLGDFMANKPSTAFGKVAPTYPIGAKFTNLNQLLPDYLTSAMKLGIVDMDKRLKGFNCYDAVLVGAETRTSSPIRVIRNENMCSPVCDNAYPVGETGYAGGIMSSAIDGIKVAKKIIEKYIF